MLATITLATDHGWFGTWLGSTLGMVAADALAIVVGRRSASGCRRRPSPTAPRPLFFLFGIWLGIEAIAAANLTPAGGFRLRCRRGRRYRPPMPFR